MSHADVLLIGGGPASLHCAEALRDGGFSGSVVLLTRELDPPYDRPPLSKGYLAGSVVRDTLGLRSAEWYAERDIDLRTRTGVMKLDPAARTVTLAGKDTLEYDRALLATGAQVRRLRVEGGGLEGIHYLRAPGNADAIRRDLDAGGVEDVVVVGGSYLGCELAATLAASGRRVTMVMLEDAPLSAHFGAPAGEWFAQRLLEHGIELACGEPLRGFEGDERVAAVLTQSGRRIPAQLALMATGAVPDVMLARAAGLELGETGGVACDATLATAAPGLWAAGDMCEYDSAVHGRRLRVEHWEHAVAQGRHVARALLGDTAPFTEIPYFWSDLADWCTLESVGPVESHDRGEVRGSLDGESWTMIYSEGERVVGALTVGRPEDLDEVRSLMASAPPFTG